MPADCRMRRQRALTRKDLQQQHAESQASPLCYNTAEVSVQQVYNTLHSDQAAPDAALPASLSMASFAARVAASPAALLLFRNASPQPPLVDAGAAAAAAALVAAPPFFPAPSSSRTFSTAAFAADKFAWDREIWALSVTWVCMLYSFSDFIACQQ